MIRAAQVFFALGAVELDHRRPAIPRMQLHGVKAVVVNRMRGAYADGVGMAAAPFGIAAVEYRHVAADAA